MIHKISNVITRCEVITFASQDDCPYRKIPGCLIERSSQICIHIPGESVHLFGTIEREAQNTFRECVGDVTHG